MGDSHPCALVAGGSVKCWGNNSTGQLGDGTKTNRTSAVVVSGISGAKAIALGAFHSCALGGGAVKCWGYNGYGQLGDGTWTTNRTTSVDVAGLSGATAIALGLRHSCAIGAGGSVKCWGSNGSGQLGFDPGWTPRSVAGIG